MKNLRSIEGNRQRLDGGAMFGNVPRSLWSRWLPPDRLGRVPLASRALLWRHPQGLVLFETGIGAFFEPGLRDRYGVDQPRHVLLDSLRAAGCSHEDIDVVVLSHLHFDHAGGLLSAWSPGSEPSLLFPRATFVAGTAAWRRARRPHARDRASFIPGLARMLATTGRLELVAGGRSETLGDSVRFHRSVGHTPGMLLAEIPSSAGPVLFCADLVPGRPWVHLPITMGYDRFPERLVDEKRRIFRDIVSRGGWLFFTHDHAACIGRLATGQRGRFVVTETRGVLGGERA